MKTKICNKRSFTKAHSYLMYGSQKEAVFVAFTFSVTKSATGYRFVVTLVPLAMSQVAPCGTETVATAARFLVYCATYFFLFCYLSALSSHLRFLL